MDESIENSRDWPALKTRRVTADGMDGWDKARFPSIYIATRILVRVFGPSDFYRTVEK